MSLVLDFEVLLCFLEVSLVIKDCSNSPELFLVKGGKLYDIRKGPCALKTSMKTMFLTSNLKLHLVVELPAITQKVLHQLYVVGLI